MAQIIQFPSGISLAPAHAPARKALSKPKVPAKPKSSSIVVAISKRVRIPKQNRPEDEIAIAQASLAKRFADRAYELAQSDPNSKEHRVALHMSGVAQELPRNNLRVLTTRDDVMLGVWGLWRRVRIACLECELCDARRMEAHHADDEEGARIWEERQNIADGHRWSEYERLVRVPANTLHEFNTYKLSRDFKGGMGSLEWMRRHKAELAAILDEELARLESEKATRKTARVAKKGESQ